MAEPLPITTFLTGLSAVRRDSLFRLLEQARRFGFLGPGPVDRHVCHALGFAAAIDSVAPPAPGSRAVDLGSGGGVPGLILACVWPEVHWTLLDSMERRTTFLRSALMDLHLDGDCEVQRIRAEEAGRGESRAAFGLVTARGFGGPAATAECGATLLQVGGMLVVSEPPDSAGDRWSDDGLILLGLKSLGPVRVQSDDGAQFGYQLLTLEKACPAKYPRAVGQASKRPLWY